MRCYFVKQTQSSVRPRVLCVSVVNAYSHCFTTEAQRTRSLHREEKERHITLSEEGSHHRHHRAGRQLSG